MNGRGIYEYGNGDYYEGEWKNGKKYGVGVYYNSELGQSTEGIWRFDRFIN